MGICDSPMTIKNGPLVQENRSVSKNFCPLTGGWANPPGKKTAPSRGTMDGGCAASRGGRNEHERAMLGVLKPGIGGSKRREKKRCQRNRAYPPAPIRRSNNVSDVMIFGGVEGHTTQKTLASALAIFHRSTLTPNVGDIRTGRWKTTTNA